MHTNSDIFLKKPTHFVRSTAVDEVLSQPPSWLLRWGITVFFVVLMVLLLVGWFVQYSDLVKANLRVVATNAPKPVMARSDGLLEKLFVKDGQNVEKGQRLAFLESMANHDEVLALSQVVDTLVVFSGRSDIGAMYDLEVPAFFQLGELQQLYQSLDTAYVVRVNFPKGLVTSSQKTIPFCNGLTASGEIVTENLNLIERLFYELRRVWNPTKN